MPNSSIISLDLRNVDKWVVSDEKPESASSAYSQKEIKPEVQWTINTLPTLEGIRSTSIFSRDDLLNFPPRATNRSNLFQIDNIIDVFGNITYVYIDGTLDIGRTYTMDIVDGIENIPFINSLIAAPTFMHIRHTLLQNRTIFLFSDGDTIGEGFTVNGDVASTNCFIELDLVNRIAYKRAVTGTSVDASDKNGLVSWGNYAILWNKNTVFWSDPQVFTEFTVGGSSLAGSQKISEAKGNILTIVPNPTGLAIYCQDNIIQASYSGDASNPWIFTEVTNGAGLLLLDGQPLVTRNENSAFHVAHTNKGLLVVRDTEAVPLPEAISNFVINNVVEVKNVGSSKIEFKDLSNIYNKKPKLKNMYLHNGELFLVTGVVEADVTIGKGSELLSRLYIFNLTTGKLGVLEGDFVSVTPEIERQNTIATSDLHNQNRIYAESFVLTRRSVAVPDPENPIDYLRNDILDFGSRADNLVTYGTWGPRKSEVFIGNIALRKDTAVEVIAVELEGSFYRDVTPSGVYVDLAEVWVYTDYLGDTSPKQFTYHPKLNKFLGFAVGRVVQVEVRGDNFFLNNINIEVQQGGR